MSRRLFNGLAFIAPAAPAPAMAQGYPSRPVRLIVPFAASGTTDIVARIVSGRMSATLGQQVLVENKGSWWRLDRQEVVETQRLKLD
jgi:tripartite-type tricarboxylate transporter receptor subunit TctC